MNLQKIDPLSLTPRQRENYNFHKVASLLAEYGFTSIRLSDDWQGADFIAQHIDGESFLKIQLKGRLTIDKKYLNKGLYIAFPFKNSWYMLPHDGLVEHLLGSSNIGNTKSWQTSGIYHLGSINKELLQHLMKFVL